MGRWVRLVVVAAFGGGCGLLSGLDSLMVEDGGAADAAIDAETSTATDGTSTDAAIDAPLPCPEEDGSNPNCFFSKCDGATCCVTNKGGSCSAACPLGAAQLACTDPAQCPRDSGTHCCLANFSVSMTTCPWTLNAGTMTAGVTSECTTCAEELGATARICADDGDCPPGHTCHLVELLMSVEFGVCM